MARKPTAQMARTKQPPPPARQPRKRRQRQPQPAWWDVSLDYLGNYVLVLIASGLILWLALVFSDVFDWLMP